MSHSNGPGDRLAFEIVDVFTDRPFAGNQLAVVHGADGLTTAQCQAVAREFGYSETTFPSSDVMGGEEYATRIFTPEREIPFAGHPTLGTAWLLRSHGWLSSSECVQVCGAGRIGVRFEGPDDDARVELSATPRDLAGPLPQDLVGDLLRLVGLSASDLSGQAFVAGCGLSFVHLPVSEEAVVRAVPASRGFGALTERIAALGPVEDLLDALNVYAVSGDAPSLDVHSRVFVPGAGVSEDPATGSAAVGLGMALVASGLLPEGGRFDITQGVEMGRPSTLHGRVEAMDGRAVRCYVAGRVRSVASGEIALPLLPADSAGLGWGDPGRSVGGLDAEHQAVPRPVVGGGHGVTQVVASRDQGRGGRLPQLVPGAYDGHPTDPGDQSPAGVLAAHQDLDPVTVDQVRQRLFEAATDDAQAAVGPRVPHRMGPVGNPDPAHSRPPRQLGHQRPPCQVVLRVPDGVAGGLSRRHGDEALTGG
jgi:trans-2,3-dihydro-3-hydroxyanthranilate isomerase